MMDVRVHNVNDLLLVARVGVSNSQIVGEKAAGLPHTVAKPKGFPIYPGMEIAFQTRPARIRQWQEYLGPTRIKLLELCFAVGHGKSWRLTNCDCRRLAVRCCRRQKIERSDIFCVA